MVSIVQSLFLYKNKFTYKNYVNESNSSLNFYSFLLSYITLKTYYKSVTMICNQYAYDTIIKFIPYDNVTIDTNDIDFKDQDFDKFWTIKKINVYNSIASPFIHIDGDVMLFNDVLKEFYTGNYDIICQNIENVNNFNHYNVYSDLLYDELANLNIFKSNRAKCNPINCAVVGLIDENVKNEYIHRCNQIYDLVYKKYYNELDSTFPIYLEQFVLGTVVLDYNLKVYEVLNKSSIEKHGMLNSGNNIGYTHLWGNSKFKTKYINLIKEKIKIEYSNYYNLIEKFELKNAMICINEM